MLQRPLLLLLFALINAPLLLAQEDTLHVQTLTYDSITTRRGSLAEAWFYEVLDTVVLWFRFGF